MSYRARIRSKPRVLWRGVIETMNLFFKKYQNQIIAFLLILIIIVLVIFLILSYADFLKKRSAQSKEIPVRLKNYESKNFSFKLKYPEDLIEGKIKPEDQEKDPLMLKLVRENPPILILFWQEGLGIVANLIKQPLIEYLRDNVDRRYSVEFNDFKKEKQENLKIGNLDGFSVEFTFQDKEKEYREKIREIIIVRENNAYHLQCLAPVEEWSSAEKACQAIKKSFQFTP